MFDKDKIALAKYRVEKAKETLMVSKLNFENAFYLDSVNRSYYAIFHALRAILALESVDFQKHSAVIAHFQQYYIKTNIFDKRFSKIIADAFKIRNDSDYEDFYVLSKESVEEQIKNAADFINEIEKYVLSQKIL